jgi:hypothetical protein
MTIALVEARWKLKENNFDFDSLPEVRKNDSIIWEHLQSAPYNFTLPELSAIINLRCSTGKNKQE